MSAEEIITNILLKYYECMEENDKFESEEKCLSIIVDGAAESDKNTKILEEKLKQKKMDLDLESAELKEKGGQIEAVKIMIFTYKYD